MVLDLIFADRIYTGKYRCYMIFVGDKLVYKEYGVDV